jgi:hypothetical protein
MLLCMPIFAFYEFKLFGCLGIQACISPHYSLHAPGDCRVHLTRYFAGEAFHHIKQGSLAQGKRRYKFSIVEINLCQI